MEVAVRGYNTQLGRQLVVALKENGYSIREISVAKLKLPADVLGHYLNGVDAIVDVDRVPYFSKWTSRYQYNIYASRLAAMRAISSAMKYVDKAPSFYLTLSNAMGYDSFEVHDDYSQLMDDDSFMAEMAEMELQEATRIQRYVKNIRLSVFRIGFVMATDSPEFKVIRKAAKLGLAGIVDDGYQCLPIIHREDLIAAIMFVLKRPDCQGVFNVTIPEIANMIELSKAVHKFVWRPQISLPKWVLRILMGRSVAMLEHNCKVIPVRLSSLGFTFKYPNIQEVINSILKK
ncbi:MAG: DUF1731 domain-containing protein [Marinilabiliaceae bacterium]|nr:DUF1731 domain-containing protein [Marinilabiliaceae bacterium]